jgi:cellulose synthase/poly-beta-1,6-N-acetylglucosamine synthase-like glycosyltransferase
MNVRSIAGYAYSNARLTWKRIRYNYYLKNRIECKRNKELLKKVRDNPKDDLNKNPLISVRIPTYNRGKILTERTIPSVIRQTYQNFEIIIVGDHCTDNTEELLKDFNDERIKFYNLPERGKYPTNPQDRWMVAGVVPMNKGIELCAGDWIAPLDDDDEFSEDHLEMLLNYALEYDYEMVYGVVQMEMEPSKWVNLGSYPIWRAC